MDISGQTIYFLGKLAASNRKEAIERVRQIGGQVVRQLGPDVNVVVVGEGGTQDWNLWNEQLDAATRDAFERGSLEIASEASFWDRLGSESTVTVSEGPFYTPSDLAKLSCLPITTIRQLQRRGLIVPFRQVYRLPYFDVQTVLLLKIVRTMLDVGVSINIAVDRLRKFRRRSTNAPLNVDVMGKDIVFLTQSGLVDQNGQRRLPLVEDPPKESSESRESPSYLANVFEPVSLDFENLCSAAWELESSGDLSAAVELYRTTLAAHGPNAQLNFQLAELLYRLGDLPAARERYFMAVEIDDEFVEARANLGCVLAELGDDELAVAAFRGALRYHPDYAEVRFHLGMLLDRLGFLEEAEENLRLFLDQVPDSPWTEKALEKLGNYVCVIDRSNPD